MSKTLVSIAVLTYNHEQFLEQALESFLVQNTTFDFEIVIGDDASTDRTQTILKSFHKKHPNKFNIVYQKTNIGMIPNFIDVISRCNGKYIAFCEGDDYWINSEKLQIQTNFLEANEDYAICFHEAKIYDETTKELKSDTITNSEKEDYDLSDLVKGNFMHTPTVVLRNDFSLPEDFSTLPIGDWPLYLNMLKHRKIKKLNHAMSVYRVHTNSSWSSKSITYRLKRSITTIKYILNTLALSESQQKDLKTTLKTYKKELLKRKLSFFKR